MAKVQLLERSIAERIAAGEVVERPASVVKELVENCLDAGATQVTVELQAGGTTRIRVIDDGCGMAPDDARLALERFATSKIRLWEDLDVLASLGFRGEALPSIAAVSKLEIVTCERGAAHGCELIVEGGVILREAPAASVPGTRITVSDLFFNTPARRKFLKTPAAETSQVVELITRLALTNPGVQFQVRSNGREILLVTRGMDASQRMAALWKIPLEGLTPVRGELAGMQLEGWVAQPQFARPTRSNQIFAINGRLIKSATLSQAVLEGFMPLVARGKYPAALLRIDLDPSMVDVNVHPTKAEVRFADSRTPFRIIYRSVAAALQKSDADTVDPHHWDLVETPAAPSYPWDSSAEFEPVSPRGGSGGGPMVGRVSEGPPVQTELRPSPGVPAARPVFPNTRWTPPPVPAGGTPAVLELYRPLEDPADVVVLAQLHRTFIVAQVEGALWVVDQHTAHERIWYERLGHLSPLSSPVQSLLVPEVLELNAQLLAYLEGFLEPLLELGFEVEPFGGNAFQLRGVPSGIKPHRAAAVLRETLELAATESFTIKGSSKEQLREKLRAMVSCKSAIKAGDSMNPEEMRHLIAEMLKVEHSNYCPHGRPTRVRLDQVALERLFHR
jgi:DNA mismatch repair protein MutL